MEVSHWVPHGHGSLDLGDTGLCPIFHHRTKLCAAVARAGQALSSAWEGGCALEHRSDSSPTRRCSGPSADPTVTHPGDAAGVGG